MSDKNKRTNGENKLKLTKLTNFILTDQEKKARLLKSGMKSKYNYQLYRNKKDYKRKL